MTVKSLHTTLENERQVSLRAVYKAVDKLIAAGVVLKAGKRVFLDQEWALRVHENLQSGAEPLLSEGERASYTFVSLEHLDAFWKTAVLPLEHSTSTKEIFFYNPHNFWAYLPARKKSEDAYYAHFAQTKRHGFFTIGGDSAADREFKSEYENEHLQIDLRAVGGFKRTDHITLIGPFVVSVRLGKGVSEAIDRLYASGKQIKEIVPELLKISRKPGRVRFLIEHNPARATKMRTLLAKNFYFKTI